MFEEFDEFGIEPTTTPTKLLEQFRIGTTVKPATDIILYTMYCHHMPPSKEEYKKQTVVNDVPFHIMLANVPIEEYKERKRLGLPILICDQTEPEEIGGIYPELPT